MPKKKKKSKKNSNKKKRKKISSKKRPFTKRKAKKTTQRKKKVQRKKASKKKKSQSQRGDVSDNNKNTPQEIIFKPKPEWIKNGLANKSKYQIKYSESIKNNNSFWKKEGKRITWIKPYKKIKDVK